MQRTGWGVRCRGVLWSAVVRPDPCVGVPLRWQCPVSPLQTALQTHYAGVFSFGTYSLYAQFYHDLLGSYLATGTTGSCSSSSDCASVSAEGEGGGGGRGGVRQGR